MKTKKPLAASNITAALNVNPGSLLFCLENAHTRTTAGSLVCAALTLIACSKKRKAQNRKRNRNCNAEIPNPAPVRKAENIQPALTLVPTVLPIVYKVSGTNRLEVLAMLDLSRKNEVWGWRLQSGILWKRTLRNENERVYNRSYAGFIAERLEFDGKQGHLPFWKRFLNTVKDAEAPRRIAATAAVLNDYGIPADNSFDCCCWCEEKAGYMPSYFIQFNKGHLEPCYENAYADRERIAIAFD